MPAADCGYNVMLLSGGAEGRTVWRGGLSKTGTSSASAWKCSELPHLVVIAKSAKIANSGGRAKPCSLTYRLVDASRDRLVFMLVTVRPLSRSRFSGGPSQLVTVHLTSTLRLPQRCIPHPWSHISFLGIFIHILQHHECRLPHELVIGLNDHTNPQLFMGGKTRNGPEIEMTALIDHLLDRCRYCTIGSFSRYQMWWWYRPKWQFMAPAHGQRHPWTLIGPEAVLSTPI